LDKNTHISRTLFFTAFLSIFAIAIAFILQSTANKSVRSFSYLDPISVDILATTVAAFLIIEGFWDIFRHKHYALKAQVTKSIRISIGFAILTIHIMQFIHK
jgi:hypothetical protein